MTTPRESLARLRALHEAATPAPWRGGLFWTADRDEIIEKMRTDWVGGPESVPDECLMVNAGQGEEVVTACITGNGPKRRDNTKLIAAMRNALPQLLAVAEAAEALSSHVHPERQPTDAEASEGEQLLGALRAALAALKEQA